MKNRKKEKVYCYLVDRNLYAERQSNQTILVARHKLPDSDRLILTDRKGHRYARNSISLEQHCIGYYIFNII